MLEDHHQQLVQTVASKRPRVGKPSRLANGFSTLDCFRAAARAHAFLCQGLSAKRAAKLGSPAQCSRADEAGRGRRADDRKGVLSVLYENVRASADKLLSHATLITTYFNQRPRAEVLETALACLSTARQCTRAAGSAPGSVAG